MSGFGVNSFEQKFSKKITATNTGYSFMPAWQPSANSLQADARGEFAGTSHSQSLAVIKKLNMSKIELNQEEHELYQKVKQFSLHNEFEQNEEILEASKELTLKLLERDAIPERRLNYFTEPKYNIGRTKKSRKEVFESNGTIGEDVFADPNFLKYLDYFINGANLATGIKNKASELFSNKYFQDTAINNFYSYLKGIKIIPQNSSERHEFAEEIFKLVIDYDFEFKYCNYIRNKILGR